MKGVFPAVKDYSRYKAAYEKRLKREERKREPSALKAARAAKKVAAMLARACGVKKVVLFGSVIDGSFREASDIDLVVEGLENMDAVAESLACLPGKIWDAADTDRKYLLESAGFELQAEKILPLIKKLPETRKEFRKDMEEFLGFLKSIAV